MSRIAVDKTLIKGSPKQRVMLLLNHFTDINSGGKGLMSKLDYNSLSSSFKTDSEVKVYNRFKNYHSTATNYLSSMAQYRFMLMVAIERLDKFIIIYKNNLDTDDLVNCLIELMPDKEKKRKAQNIAINFSDVFKRIEVSEDFLIQTDNSTLLNSIKEAQEEVDSIQRLLKTSIKAIKDYFTETGLNIKIFNAYVKEIERWVKGDSDKGITKLTKLPKKYRKELRYEDVEIDEVSYDHIRKSILIIEDKND